MSYSHLLPSGKTETRIYLAPHFRRTAAGWVPLSSRLRTVVGAVQAPGTIRPFTFGSRSSQLLTIGTGAGPLRLSASNIDVASRRTRGSSVIYPNVAPQTTLSYRVFPFGTDEKLILNGPHAPHVFNFTLHDPRHTLGQAIRQTDGGYRFSAIAPDGNQMGFGALTVSDSTPTKAPANKNHAQPTGTASPSGTNTQSSSDSAAPAASSSSTTSPSPEDATPSTTTSPGSSASPTASTSPSSTATSTAPESHTATAGHPASAHSARLSVRSVPGGYAITESIDQTWLAGATFPVTLDPSVMFAPRTFWYNIPAVDAWGDDDGGYCDTLGEDPNHFAVPSHQGPTLPVGGNPENGFNDIESSYIRWDASGLFGPGTVFQRAVLHLTEVGGHGPDTIASLYRFGWSYQSGMNGNDCAVFDGFWDNPSEPGYETRDAAYISTGSAAKGVFDVTAPFQEWINDPSTNNGLTIASDNTYYQNGTWYNGAIFGSLFSSNPEYLDVVTAGNIVPPTALPTNQVQGDPCTCATNGNDNHTLDPVNTGTGDTVEHVVDASIGSGAAGLTLTRTYDSGITANGPFGEGWSMQQLGSLTYDSSTGLATVTVGDGSTLAFARQPDGSYLPPVGATSTLVDNGNGWTLTTSRNVAYTFSPDGTVASVADPLSGDRVSFTYANGQLATATDQNGNQLTVTYGTNGFISTVGVPGGRSVSYSYTGNELTGVTALDGTSTTYAYDSNGHLSGITTPNGTTTNTYDPATGRLTQQKDAAGNITTLSWDANSQTETITYPRGGVETDVYSGNVLVSKTDPDGGTTKYFYDANDNLAGVTDPLHNTTTYTYNAANQMTSEVGPSPDNFTQSWAYDGQGRLHTYTDADGGVTTYGYDANGHIATVTDALGNVTDYNYNGAGQLLSSVDPRGTVAAANPATYTTSYSYDGNGYPHTVTDPDGHTTTTVYNAAGQLVSSTDGAGDKTTYTYDNAGRVLTMTDPRGNVTGGNPAAYTTTYTYYPSGQLDSVTDPLSGVTSYTYTADGQQQTVTDPNHNVTRYGYDTDGNLTSVTDPTGAVTSYTYDLADRKTSMINPIGNAQPSGTDLTPYTTKYYYDANGEVIRTVVPLYRDSGGYLYEGAILTGYDNYGHAISVTDASGYVTSTSYDGDGHVLSTTTPAGGVTSNAYDLDGRLTSTTDPNYNTTSYGYDVASNRTSVTDQLGDTTSYSYDPAGVLVATVDPRGNVTGGNPAAYTTTYGYDTAGRQTSVTDPLGNKTTYGYDPAGNQTTVTDPRGNVTGGNPAAYTTTTSYDALNRVTQVATPASGTTKDSYDADGNLLTYTDGNNQPYTYTYDADNRQLSAKTPLGNLTSDTYTLDGKLATVTTPLGNATPTAGDGTITYSYDYADRLAGTSYSDGTPAVSYIYNANNGIASITDAGGKVTYTYNSVGQVTGIARGTNSLNYTYDPAGNVSSVALATNGTTTATIPYTYDADERLASVGTTVGTEQLGYDPAGDLTSLTTPSAVGTTETRSYDADQRITAVTNKHATTTISAFTQSYDPASNVASAAATSAGTTTNFTYQYDANNRLLRDCFATSCTSPTTYINYGYDNDGNRTTQTRVGSVANPGTTTYTYNNDDQLTQAKVGTTTTAYTYDANGNQTAAGTRTFAYNLAGELTSTVLPGARGSNTTTSYTYDGQGNRLTESINGTLTTNYLWDTQAPMPMLYEETNNKNALVRSYTYNPTTGSPLSMTTSGGTFYYLHDSLGDVSDFTDAKGATQYDYTYEPFGPALKTTQVSNKAPSNPILYTGQYLDDTSLYNLRAREYDPTTGRFLTVDPMLLSTLQPYQYANGNPLRSTDPSGRLPECPPLIQTTADDAKTGVDPNVKNLFFGDFGFWYDHDHSWWQHLPPVVSISKFENGDTSPDRDSVFAGIAAFVETLYLDDWPPIYQDCHTKGDTANGATIFTDCAGQATNAIGNESWLWFASHLTVVIGSTLLDQAMGDIVKRIAKSAPEDVI